MAVICASAPALTVLVRQYLGTGDSPSSNPSNGGPHLKTARSRLEHSWRLARDESTIRYDADEMMPRKYPSIYDLEEFSDVNLHFMGKEGGLCEEQKSISTSSSSLNRV